MVVDTRSSYRRKKLRFRSLTSCGGRRKRKKRDWEETKTVLREMLMKRRRFVDACTSSKLSEAELRRLFETGRNETCSIRYVERKHSKGIVVCLPGMGGGLSGPSGLFERICKRRTSSTLILNTGYNPEIAKQIALYAISWLKKKRKMKENVVLVGYSMGVATAAACVEMYPDLISGICCVSSQSAQTEGLTKIRQGGQVLLIHHTNDQILPQKDTADLIFQMLIRMNVNVELCIFGEKESRCGGGGGVHNNIGLECLRQHTLFDESDDVYKRVHMFLRTVLL
jgi:dienelactone hydrolase